MKLTLTLLWVGSSFTRPCFRRSATFAHEIFLRYENKAPALSTDFIGVWDTVGALGIPLRGLRGLTRGKYQFHDTELSGTVRYAYHALAIDERRAPFESALWAHKPKPGQTVEQVWFSGAYSDVGGGYPETGLSDIALDWMVAKARSAGLLFDDATMQAHPLDPDPLGTLHNSKNGLYRLTAGINRVIGWSTEDPKHPQDAPKRDDPTQSVHASALGRRERDPSYRPVGLEDYFTRIE